MRRVLQLSLTAGLLLAAGGCAFEPAFEGYRRCAEGCPPACTCLADRICVPRDPSRPPAICFLEEPACERAEACPVGCLCQGQDCLSPPGQELQAYCDGLEQDLSCRGPTWTVDSEQVLRQKLSDYATEPGPHGIIFHPSLGGELEITQDLPPVPSLTFIDGGLDGFTLRGAGARYGLRVAGRGVILGRLKLVDFSGPAVVVQGEAADVHLYRMRLGEPGAGNGEGLRIEPGARQVTLGRGRELACSPSRSWPYQHPPEDLGAWDVNVIAGNRGPGILAEGVRDLLVEGTWVGFDPVADPGHGHVEGSLGNQGPGIHLKDVWRAFLGPRHLNDLERVVNQDFRPGCLAVGRSAQGGVWLEGGGEIDMRCALIGDTPVMDPWDENLQFGLKIEQNQGPVHYGPRPEAVGFEALALNLIHTEGAPALVVQDAAGPVVVRGAQLQRLFAGNKSTDYGVVVQGRGTRVELVHLNLLGEFRSSFIQVGAGAGLVLKNSLIWAVGGEGTRPAVKSGTDPSLLELAGNVSFDLGALCADGCPTLLDPSNRSLPGGDADCGYNGGPRPTLPDCPLVDCGLELGLDVNGPAEGRHFGCGPDVGAFECASLACQAPGLPCPPPHCQ
jgi:hypothetical protein